MLFQLVKVPPNALPEVSSYPLMTVALMIQMGSLVAPFMEVAGLRGYFQIANRQEFLIRSACPGVVDGTVRVGST